MKSKIIIKDAFILFIITIISGALLGYVYELTKGPIEEQNLLIKQESYKTVFSDAESFEESEDLSNAILEAREVLDEQGFENITIDEVLLAKDKSNNMMGYVMTITTGEGYGGDISLTIGMKQDGTLNGIEILSINETAGLGQKANDTEFKEQFSNKKVEAFVYTKTGKTADYEIDALSGATITTSAVMKAVNAGIFFVNNCVENLEGGQ